MTISAILASHTHETLTAQPHESVGEVVSRLAEHRIEKIEGEAAAMRDYISMS